MQIRGWTQNKTLAASFPIKIVQFREGIWGLSALFHNICGQQSLADSWILSKSVTRGNAHTCKWHPSSTSAPLDVCVCEIQTVQDRGVRVSESSSKIKSYETQWGVIRVAFEVEKQSLACPILCSNFDKNMFLITGSLRRICPWEWQNLQLEEGSDRIRGRTKRSGFHPCAVALSGLKYKKQFCYGRFLECPWQKCDWRLRSTVELPSVLQSNCTCISLAVPQVTSTTH